ncbi:unnamed protein product [Phytomonas sp. EM1]|nr:unnamed protein product [Phytomonas sp. EM1]|eukprot:CCW60354.1 unnamed protein product [Phytomonas sp. isolate EM1]
MQDFGGNVGTAKEVDVTRCSQLMNSIASAQVQSMKQQEQIRAIIEENTHLKNEITAVSGSHYDYVKADKMAVLQGEVDALERRYQFEKMRKNDLMKRYQMARIELFQSRKKKGGINVEKEQAESVQRQVDILENRLDQALGKFNDALSYNKELRNQISIIREERRVFQRVHKKMEDDLRSKKSLMSEYLEQTNKDMDERDEYLRELDQLREAIILQQEENSKQLHELDLAMLEIKSMREEQANLQLELEAREYEFEKQLLEVNTTTNRSDVGAGAGSRRCCGADEDNDSSDDLSPMANALRVEHETGTIKEIIAQLRESLHEDDPNVILEKYQQLGDSNYSMYRLINELTAAKEAFNDEIRDLKNLLDEENKSEAGHRQLVKQLEENLAATESKLEQVQNSIGRMRDDLSIVIATTENVYAQIGCSSMKDITIVKEQCCNESNLMNFMGVIEERVTRILCAMQRRRRNYNTPLHMESTICPKPADTDSEDNALSAKTESPCLDLLPALSAIEFDNDETDPIMVLPIAPSTVHNALSAQQLVRPADLPSANLIVENSLLSGFDNDQVVSHEEIRRRMEAQLVCKREREERAQRKKKEMTSGGRNLSRLSPEKRNR